MAHVEDRWYKSIPDPDNPKKKIKIKTDRYGIGGRYRVRWLDPDGEERSKTFPDGQYKAAANWKSKQEVDLLTGDYVDPKAGKVTVEAFAKSWIADLDIDELSRQNLEMRFRKRGVPVLRQGGDQRGQAVRDPDVGPHASR